MDLTWKQSFLIAVNSFVALIPETNEYKTLYFHNLLMFIISTSVCPRQALQALSNVCGWSQEPTLEWGNCKVVHSSSTSLTHKHKTKLERLVRDKHNSLLWTFINYGLNFFSKHWTQVLMPWILFSLFICFYNKIS